MRLMLRGMGHEVTAVTSGKEAIEAFKVGDYELVITDLGMPDISGYDVAQAVKNIDPEVLVLLITGWGVQVDLNKMPEINAVVSKPFSKETLSEQIAELIGTDAPEE